jgi:catechol 2,3-dioxygenase-like lactoylglutathione lyase family enzyme
MTAKWLSTATVACVCLCGSAAAAQTPPPAASAAAGLIVGSGNFFSPIVSNLDRAIAFYHDGLGLDIAQSPSNAETNPGLRNMFGLPDAHLRWMVGQPPGIRGGVEMVEITGAAGQPADRRIQDVGAFTLIVLVRDLDTAFTRLKQLGAPVVTTGGAPITFPFGNGKSRGVVVKDPDGHFVELFQFDPPRETTAPASANILGVRVRLAVADVPQAMHLYTDVMGLERDALDDFKSDPNVSAMFGLSGAQFRLGTTKVPGSGLVVEFIDFKGVERRTVSSRLQDPGSTRMQLRVRDIDAAIDAFRRAGGSVVSTGGSVVELPGRAGAPPTRVAIVRDPNNLFVVLLQLPPAPPSR